MHERMQCASKKGYWTKDTLILVSSMAVMAKALISGEPETRCVASALSAERWKVASRSVISATFKYLPLGLRLGTAPGLHNPGGLLSIYEQLARPRTQHKPERLACLRHKVACDNFLVPALKMPTRQFSILEFPSKVCEGILN